MKEKEEEQEVRILAEEKETEEELRRRRGVFREPQPKQPGHQGPLGRRQSWQPKNRGLLHLLREKHRRIRMSRRGCGVISSGLLVQKEHQRPTLESQRQRQPCTGHPRTAEEGKDSLRFP